MQNDGVPVAFVNRPHIPHVAVAKSRVNVARRVVGNFGIGGVVVRVGHCFEFVGQLVAVNLNENRAAFGVVLQNGNAFGAVNHLLNFVARGRGNGVGNCVGKSRRGDFFPVFVALEIERQVAFVLHEVKRNDLFGCGAVVVVNPVAEIARGFEDVAFVNHAEKVQFANERHCQNERVLPKDSVGRVGVFLQDFAECRHAFIFRRESFCGHEQCADCQQSNQKLHRRGKKFFHRKPSLCSANFLRQVFKKRIAYAPEHAHLCGIIFAVAHVFAGKNHRARARVVGLQRHLHG